MVEKERQPLHGEDLVGLPSQFKSCCYQSKAPDPAGGQRVTNTAPVNCNKVRAEDKAKVKVQNPLANLDSFMLNCKMIIASTKEAEVWHMHTNDTVITGGKHSCDQESSYGQ